MELTCLMENTTHCNLPAEHGLSLYLETGQHHILFDTGPDGVFADNARKLGVDLGSVDAAVLSHGHYDHGGGLRRFFECNNHAPVYASPYVFGEFYNEAGKYIGLDPQLIGNTRFTAVYDKAEIDEGILVTSCRDEKILYPADPYGLCVVRDGEKVPDVFDHEQYLIVEENHRRIVFSGCSHRGILNIVHWLKPDVFIGGFHLMHETQPEVLDRAADVLLASGADFYTCHCTGQMQFDYLKARMGDRLHAISCGDRITI